MPLIALLLLIQSDPRDSEFELDWLPPQVEAQNPGLYLHLVADSNAYLGGTIFQIQLFPVAPWIDWRASRIESAPADAPAAWVTASVRGGFLEASATVPSADRFEVVANFTPDENLEPRIRRWMAREYRFRIHRWEFRAVRASQAAARLGGEAQELRGFRDAFLAFADEFYAWRAEHLPLTEDSLSPWQARLDDLRQRSQTLIQGVLLAGCARSLVALPPSYQMGLTPRTNVDWGDSHLPPGEGEQLAVRYSEDGSPLTPESLQRIAARLDEYITRETGLWIAQAAWDLLQEAPSADPLPDRAVAETWFTAAQEDVAALLQADASAAASPAYATWTRVAKPEAALLHDDLDRLASFLAEHRAGLLDQNAPSAANATRLRESIEAHLGIILEKLRAGREPEEEPTDEP